MNQPGTHVGGRNGQVAAAQPALAVRSTNGTAPHAAQAARPQPVSMRLGKKQKVAMEGLQEVWHRLAVRVAHPTPAAFGVTSAIRGETRTTTALGFAAALAQETGEGAVFVEADLGSSSLAADLGDNGVAGLADYLSGDCPLWATVRQAAIPNLSMVLASRAGADTSAVAPALRRHFASAVRELQSKFAHVVVDLPPVVGSPHTAAMAGALDGVLLVVRAGQTPRDKAWEASEALRDQRLIGLVVVGAFTRLPGWLESLIGE